ncbi:hypothetical protein BCR42DRAFT_454015 [Absidia repens]|uniref:Uncharacterized protein n=1 Tax=Absidia repens TaxID=90262 RepID=A0A1X2I875_9FUNG|nr:hypothetical protein BCR42DRAFT_454015 [Absidia repens]
MDVTNSIKDILELLHGTFEYLKDRVEAYKNVGKAADELQDKIKRFEHTIELALEYETFPIFDHLVSFQKSMAASQTDIDAFLQKEQDHHSNNTTSMRSKMKTTVYKFKRATFAKDLETLFNEASTKIDQETKMLGNTILVTDRILKVGAHRFSNDMSKEAFQFWTKIYGDDLSTAAQPKLMWSHFITTYRTTFEDDRSSSSSPWTNETFDRMKAIACVNGEDLTIGGYILLTKICGFPLDPTKLPSMLDSPVSVSAETRNHVSTSINKLILFFSKEKTRNYLLAVHAWYGTARTPADRQVRANQWAIAFRHLNKKPKSKWNDDDRLVDTIDMARRTLFFFYQRVSVVFEMSQLSKDLFRRVDFPGRHRMQDFVNLIKPLDKANYVTVIGNDPEAWEKHRHKVPEVYQFADRYIASLLSKEAERTCNNASVSTNITNNHLTAPNKTKHPAAVTTSIITTPPTPPASVVSSSSLSSSSSSSSNNLSLISHPHYHHHPADKVIGNGSSSSSSRNSKHLKISTTMLDTSHINEWHLLPLDQVIMMLPTLLIILLILQISKELVLSSLLV